MPGNVNISKGSDYNAEEYAKSTAGKAIAILKVGWEEEFATNEVNFCEDGDSDDETNSCEDGDSDDEANSCEDSDSDDEEEDQ